MKILWLLICIDDTVPVKILCLLHILLTDTDVVAILLFHSDDTVLLAV